MLETSRVLSKVQLEVLLCSSRSCQGSSILLLAGIPAQTWLDHLFSTVQSLLHVFAASSLSWMACDTRLGVSVLAYYFVTEQEQ